MAHEMVTGGKILSKWLACSDLMKFHICICKCKRRVYTKNVDYRIAICS